MTAAVILGVNVYLIEYINKFDRKKPAIQQWSAIVLIFIDFFGLNLIQNIFLNHTLIFINFLYYMIRINFN
jgi:hypothetical protein